MATRNLAHGDEDRAKDEKAQLLSEFARDQLRLVPFGFRSAYCGCVETNAMPDS